MSRRKWEEESVRQKNTNGINNYNNRGLPMRQLKNYRNRFELKTNSVGTDQQEVPQFPTRGVAYERTSQRTRHAK
jgi:hypothetical protein